MVAVHIGSRVITAIAQNDVDNGIHIGNVHLAVIVDIAFNTAAVTRDDDLVGELLVAMIDDVSVACLFYIGILRVGDGTVGKGDAVADSGNLALDGGLHVVKGERYAGTFGIIGDTLDRIQRDVLDGQMGHNEEDVNPRAGRGKGAIALDGYILGVIAV